MRGYLPLLLALALLRWTPPALAAVPVEPAIKVLVRVMSYDRSLEKRTPEGLLRIGVVFDPTLPLSAEQGEQTLAVLKDLAGTRVGPLILGEPVLLPTGPGAWPARLEGLGAVVVCRHLDRELGALEKAAEDASVATLTIEGDFVGRGLALGVVQRQARLDILVDLAAARAVGLDLSADVLQLAQVVPRYAP